MTRLASGKFRGFFDPITLGLFVDGDISDGEHPRDDITLSNIATYYHEITHYIQFFGTTLGNLYLHHVWCGLFFGLEGLRILQKDNPRLRPPFSKYDISFPEDVSKQKFVHDRCQRFFEEEFYAATYPLDETTPITDSDANIRFFSPLSVRCPDNRVFLVSARTLNGTSSGNA